MITTINPQQAKERFRTLPTSLQDVIFSPTTAELIARVGEKNHLSEDKVGLLANVVSNILLGFIHIEDIPEEIQNKVELPKELSATIAGELIVKLIGPLRQEIERSYAPESHVLEKDALSVRKASGPSVVESETTGLYPRPYDPIAPMANRVSLNMDKNKDKSPASLISDEVVKKISPLAYSDKFSISGVSGIAGSESKKAEAKVEAPKILHQETKSTLPKSNIPRLGLGLGDDKLGSIGESDNEPQPQAKFEISGISKEQMEKFERQPLPSFMKRDIPSPRVINYQNSTTPIADTGINTSPMKRGVDVPNFPIVTNTKPGITKIDLNNNTDKNKPPLPGTPFIAGQSKKEMTPIASSNLFGSKVNDELTSEKNEIIGVTSSQKKGWFNKVWGSEDKSRVSEIEGGIKKIEINQNKPTPIQTFQAKKVDYKEAPKKEITDVSSEKSKELPKVEIEKMAMPTPALMSVSSPVSVRLPESPKPSMQPVSPKSPMPPAPMREVKEEVLTVKNSETMINTKIDVKSGTVVSTKATDILKPNKSLWGSFKNIFVSKSKKDNKLEVVSVGVVREEGIPRAESPLRGLEMSDIKSINQSASGKTEENTVNKKEEEKGSVQLPKPPAPPFKI